VFFIHQGGTQIMSKPKSPSAFSNRWRLAFDMLKRNDVRISLGISVLAVLALAIMWMPGTVTTAQEKSSTAYNNALSFPQAKSIGIPERQKGEAITPIESAVNVPEGGSCGWTAGTNYPVPILDQATVSLGGNIYVFGGVSGSIIGTANKFDGTTWTPIAPLPVPVEFPTAVTNGTFIYILGGAEPTAGTPQTTMNRYDPATNTYTAMAPFTVGTWNQAAVYLNGKIYKFAGTGPATASNQALEIYDIASNTWTLGANYPEAMSFVSAFTSGGFIYAGGGINSGGSGLASLKTFRYDPLGNTWDDLAIADLPQTRWGAASSGTGYGSNNGWVLAGGYVNGVSTPNISTSVIRWDPGSNTWLSLPNMTGERARMSGAILGSSFYVIGGRSVASPAFAGTPENQKLLCVSGVAVIEAGTATLVSESFPPGNNAPDPGETVTVALPLHTSGDTATTNLIATLQATGGVTNPSPASVSYGAIAAGTTVSRNFTFTVSPSVACGSTITLTWTLADGATTYPNVTKTFTVGVRSSGLSENFDTVTPPALPAGWTTVQDVGTGITWATTATGPNSAPNSAFANDPGAVNMSSLISPPVNITTPTAQLTFRNNFATENTFDGMVLDIKIGSGAFQDILAAGGSFVSGGYTGPISTSFQSPIGGRQAWSGSSGGYIDTVVNLPAAANGQTVQFAWRMASDSSVAATGVNIDDVNVLGSYTCQGGPSSIRSRADFDGDGKTDLSVFRPSTGTWYLYKSTAGVGIINWGTSTDTPTPGDFDGDGKADTAVYRPSTGQWFILRSSDSAVNIATFGVAGDLPVAGDYDGDGKTDLAVFRPSTGVWYVFRSSDSGTSITTWGSSTDQLVPGDYDNDGKYDVGVYRPSTGQWLIFRSTGGPLIATWGVAGDKPVPADYDGDNKQDLAVYRPSTGSWYVFRSSDNTASITNWGNSTDVPAPGDFDGDGKDDPAVFRNGQWFVFQSTGGPLIATWGAAGDVPVPAKYIP
jgi:hypothetical protein